MRRLSLPWRRGLPREVWPAFFAYWAFLILHRFIAIHPVDMKSMAGFFIPSLPASSYSLDFLTATTVRRLAGHAVLLLWVPAVLGIGLTVLRMRGFPRPAVAGAAAESPAERIVLGFGLGMAVSSLLWLGLGLAGLWYSSAGWTAAGLGIAALWRERGTIRVAGGKAGDGLAGGEGSPPVWFLLAGVGTEAALILFSVTAAPLAGWRLGGGSMLPAVAAWGLASVILGGWIFFTAFLAARAAGDSGNAVERVLLRCLAALAAFGLLMLTAAAGTPERFYDAQVYHLALPVLYAAHHKAVFLPNLLHSWFPLSAHMLYGWQLLLGGEAVVRAWRPWLFGFIAWTLWRMAAREGRPRAALLAGGLFAASPILLMNSMQTSVDVEACFLVLLACLAARTGSTVVCAMLAAAAFGTKYTAVFFLPWLALLVAMKPSGPVRFGFLRPVRLFSLAVFAAVFAVSVLPWFLRNAAGTGNPVYPYATSVFKEGRQWDPARHQKFMEQSATYAVERRSDVWRLPWLLSRGQDSETFIGPVFLVFAPVAVVCPPSGAAAAAYGAVAVLALLSWLPVTHIHRFLLPAWGLFCILLAWSWWEVAARRRTVFLAGLLLMVVISAANFLILGELWRKFFDPVELLAGREDTRAFLARKMLNSYSETAVGSGTFIGHGDRVLMVGETRGLYWPARFVNHSIYDRQLFEEAVCSSINAAEAAKRLKQRGVNHLFFNEPETSRLKFRFGYPMLEFNDRQRSVINGLWERWMEERPAAGRYQRLFRLRSFPRPFGLGPFGERAPVLPLSFDAAALQREFEGYAEITWSGGGQISVHKKVVK